MGTTKIQWAQKVYNPVTGCTPCSEGCRGCYAKRMAQRLAGRYGYPKDEPFRVTFHPDRLNEPRTWTRSTRAFVGSMGDLFHDDVGVDIIQSIFDVISTCGDHTFMLLTKRAKRMAAILPHLRYIGGMKWQDSPPSHIWPGVSVENQLTANDRILDLLRIPAAKHFVSYEPALGPVNFRGICAPGVCFNALKPEGLNVKEGLDLVITGGETGPGARPVHPDWIRNVRDDCSNTGVAFVFKSWGEWLPVGQKPAEEFKPIGKKDALTRFHPWNDDDKNVSIKIGHKAAGRTLDGKIWDQIPE